MAVSVDYKSLQEYEYPILMIVSIDYKSLQEYEYPILILVFIDYKSLQAYPTLNGSFYRLQEYHL